MSPRQGTLNSLCVGISCKAEWLCINNTALGLLWAQRPCGPKIWLWPLGHFFFQRKAPEVTGGLCCSTPELTFMVRKFMALHEVQLKGLRFAGVALEIDSGDSRRSPGRSSVCHLLWVRVKEQRKNSSVNVVPCPTLHPSPWQLA